MSACADVHSELMRRASQREAAAMMEEERRRQLAEYEIQVCARAL